MRETKARWQWQELTGREGIQFGGWLDQKIKDREGSKLTLKFWVWMPGRVISKNRGKNGNNQVKGMENGNWQKNSSWRGEWVWELNVVSNENEFRVLGRCPDFPITKDSDWKSSLWNPWELISPSEVKEAAESWGLNLRSLLYYSLVIREGSKEVEGKKAKMLRLVCLYTVL